MTTCTLDDIVEWDRASSDYLLGTVSITSGVTITDQAVAITFDGTNFITAVWQDDPGTTRDWMAYLTPADIPPGVTYDVVVRITDTSGDLPVEAFITVGTITFT